MNLITKKDVIAGIAPRLDKIYGVSGRLPKKKMQDIRDALIANPEMSEQELLRLGLHKSWTRMECSSCEKEVQALVNLGLAYAGTEYEYEICQSCLTKALTLFPKGSGER